MKEISESTRALLLQYQRTEETDHLIYSRMAAREKNETNRKILSRIAANEKEHSALFQRYTGRKIGPGRFKAFGLFIMSVLFGYTFIIKLMERGEYAANSSYHALINEIPEMERIIADEQRHEDELAEMLDEERLKYVGAMVLGLNDALVELSGTIAGLTLALGNTRIVAMAGIITGVSATLSMAASNYLAERADGKSDALKSSLYTGIAYMVTVVCLVAPYLLFPQDMYISALVTMLIIVVLIIFVFNYYVAVAKSLPFGSRFREMAFISLGVMAISFVIGLLAKQILGIDI
ncbi:rubrerythrin family protein [Deltaproteobacteria bacterium Smac51]|nr:rubrerythrin family protein [Deltaproteobacteria bacterium Smac51]